MNETPLSIMRSTIFQKKTKKSKKEKNREDSMLFEVSECSFVQ